jgi:hypothetical protein
VAAGLQPKKRTVEAMEQGEFLRVAWRVMVAEKVEEGPKSACAKGLSLPLFTELPRRDVLGNWVSGVWLSRKLRRLYRRKESRGC